jgi:hypothetical protein
VWLVVGDKIELPLKVGGQKEYPMSSVCKNLLFSFSFCVGRCMSCHHKY